MDGTKVYDNRTLVLALAANLVIGFPLVLVGYLGLYGRVLAATDRCRSQSPGAR